MKIYFAHPMVSYGSEYALEIAGYLKAQGHEFLDPDHKGYVDASIAHSKTLLEQYALPENNNDMSKAYVATALTCDALVFLTMPDGSLGAGVAAQAKAFLDEGRTVYEAQVLCKGRVILTPVTDLSKYNKLSQEFTRWETSKIQQISQETGRQPYTL